MSDADLGREVAFIALSLVDYGQTRDIKNHTGAAIGIANGAPVSAPEAFRETNPLLGRNPSDARARSYFAAAIATHAAITVLLPRKFRPYWQWGTIGIEIGVVAHNAHLGLRVDY